MAGKYERLTSILSVSSSNTVDFSFDDLSDVLGGLPNSARRYAAWWANSRTGHEHAKSWLDAGYIAKPRFAEGSVRFERQGIASEQSPFSSETSFKRGGRTLLADSTPERAVSLPRRPEDTDRSMRRIGLVGCVKSKLDSVQPAADLYISPLFRFRREYVERSCDEWWILSALHGLVKPDQELGPYDVTLKNSSRSERRRWSRVVIDQIFELIGPSFGDVFEIHAGNDYRSWGLERELQSLGCRVEVPTDGMTQGVQLSFYKESL